jgi:hypothetical protein
LQDILFQCTTSSLCWLDIKSDPHTHATQIILCASWQVLILDHRVDSLALGGPWQLGTVQRGRSAWRALSQAESVAYGGSALRKLFGCVVTMLDTSNHVLPLPVTRSNGEAGREPLTPLQAGMAEPSAPSSVRPDKLAQRLLLTWSKVSSTSGRCRVSVVKTSVRYWPVSGWFISFQPRSVLHVLHLSMLSMLHVYILNCFAVHADAFKDPLSPFSSITE